MSEAETSELQNLQINFLLEQRVFWKQEKKDEVKEGGGIEDWIANLHLRVSIAQWESLRSLPSRPGFESPFWRTFSDVAMSIDNALLRTSGQCKA